MPQLLQTLRSIALRYPQTEEGIACKGTAVECTTFKARSKAFLFVGAKEIRLKLDASLAEATKLAAKEPERYKVGAHGWVAVSTGDRQFAPLNLLERWIDESYRLLVPKQLAVRLPERAKPRQYAPKTKTSVAKKKVKSR
jgi:YjbR